MAIRHVHLHAKIIFKPDIDVAEWVDFAQKVFDGSSVNIKIDLLTTEKLKLPHLKRLPIGSCDENVPITFEQEELFSHRNNVGANEIVVYFVRMTDPPNDGCARFPENAPGFVVVHDADRWTLAHELGHVLGLRHVDDALRLMFRFGTSRTVQPPPDLEAGEISKVLASSLLFNS